MGKNIIFCADGTWNGPGVDMDDDSYYDNRPTNIWKIFDNLEGEDTSDTKLCGKEQERVSSSNGSVLQIAKYIHGVGDSHNPIAKLLGGSMGAGIIKRIVRGYTFLSRNYAPDDKIFILGFSRGAYTARALAGMICSKGLLNQESIQGDRERAYMKGAAAWYDYRSSRVAAKKTLKDMLDKAVCLLPGFVAKAMNHGDYIPVDSIESVAVFDTVGALGVPLYYKDGRYDAFEFADCSLNDKVGNGLHALSVDDKRTDFTPSLWDKRDNVLQVLFPGGHCDVGGGYEDNGTHSSLSSIAKEWLGKHLAALGVRFKNKYPPKYANGDTRAHGMAHDESAHKIWKCLDSGRSYSKRTDIWVHQSVLDRWGKNVVFDPAASAPYKPVNMEGFISESGTSLSGIKIAT